MLIWLRAGGRAGYGIERVTERGSKDNAGSCLIWIVNRFIIRQTEFLPIATAVTVTTEGDDGGVPFVTGCECYVRLR